MFFRPVDGNLSYHTFLGEGFRSDFDCLVQVLGIVNAQTDEHGAVCEVILGPSVGEPKPMKLCKAPFNRLATSLKIWDAGETGYHVQADMFLACESLVWHLLVYYI